MNAPDVKKLTAPAIRLHAKDNVLVARTDLAQGTVLAEENLTCLNRIPAGHKVAARALAKGEPVLKYNTVIGFASADIAAGTLLHRLNMEFREFDRDYAHARDYQPVEMVPESERARFMGIVREDGRVATRNYIGVVSTVNSAFGCKPAPSIKLASNTPMFVKLEEDMDINCGQILDGSASMDEMGEQIFQLILRTASGKKTKSEELGLGDHEFVPWQIGITG